MNAHHTRELAFHVGEDAAAGALVTPAALMRQPVASEMRTLHASEPRPEAEIVELPPPPATAYRRMVELLSWW